MALLPYIVTSFVLTLIHLIFPVSECEHTNRLFISVQYGHFCCRVKQGKLLSEFFQKYTDSGTETTHLAGYSILVFKYVKIPTFYRGNLRKKLKIKYCIIWRCLHLMFSTTKVSDEWNVRGFERMLSYGQYPKEKSRPL